MIPTQLHHLDGVAMMSLLVNELDRSGAVVAVVAFDEEVEVQDFDEIVVAGWRAAELSNSGR